jgi:NAD(P)-dependent dehydrogenase (short-subunit alcohol dehydrogenase family)
VPQHKTILITGATRGLGRAMTEEFIRLGHTVLGCGLSKRKSLNCRNNFQRQMTLLS